MKRSSTYALVAIILTALWLKLKYKSSGISSSLAWYVDVAPWYLLIAFGSYCLARLGYDLLTFNDYPNEIKKLEQVSIPLRLQSRPPHRNPSSNLCRIS